MALQLPGTGPHRFWGFSPSYDVRNLACLASSPADADAKHTSLLICPGDIRHVLHTLANARASEAAVAQQLTFHVYEEQPECLARHLLLLSIALDFELPRRERAEIFLEVMGNTMVRERSGQYLAARAKELLRLLGREEGPFAAHIDLSSLKMKERDALEDVLATWAEGVQFEVEKLRDERLRGFYKDRYDVRRNVLDWDYSMGLVETAPGIHRIHFREWRLSGQAYEVRDAAYNTPNRSLASAAAGRQRGASVLKRGFWGDVANSPYSAVGVECDDERFFKKRSDQLVKNACDVAYYNVVNWFAKLETGKGFAVKPEDFDDFTYGASVGGAGFVKGFLRSDQPGPQPQAHEAAQMEEMEEILKGDDEAAAAVAKTESDRARSEAEEARVRQEVVRRRRAALPKFTLVLHTGGALDVLARAKLAKACAHVHVASHAAHLLSAPLAALLTERAVVAVETARFLCEVHKEAKVRLALKLAELGARAGLAQVKEEVLLDGKADALVIFGYERPLEEVRRAAALERFGVSLRGAEEAAAPAAEAMTAEPESELAEATTEAMLRGVRLDDAPAAAAAPGVLVGERPAATAAKPTDAIGTACARVCAITGLPAKYRDPKTGSYYATGEAFKELRRRHAEANGETAATAPSAAPASENVAAAESNGALAGTPAEDDVIRPKGPSLVVSSGGVTRRLNKVV
ncbi:hypothetical protein T492DRAFT_1017924 [Pavlovales sp. CCMP2436]|nr:hypothetical protein T492DRAFT_1017924 [Pavlovales sp. CCMP2436]|mmetsp:Transcript_2094/g.5203  ORF Transcript_2094/g.5203 Transcript_2094/m.5203 type:complete len:693 (+) Transcript_2094:119-2197(+)